MAKIISGKEVAAALNQKTAKEVEELKAKGVEVSLAVILVGDDPASKVYVNNKKKSCEKLGITSYEFLLPAETQQSELLSLIDELNSRDDISGILCQLPLPAHLDERAVLDAVSPNKDVDCFNPVNVGKMTAGIGKLLPCTPAGIMEMLAFEGIEPKGKTCAVIGRSNIVGKPISTLMLNADATVTICHSKTQNLSAITSQADILVAAVGKPLFVKADMVKEGAVVIDVGIHRKEDGKLCGDVDFASVEPKASYITPVPGGVGPMTIAQLMQNTVVAAKINNNLI